MQAPQPASACATCGCSELCALNLFGDQVDKSKQRSLLTDSIWGRLILGIAYNHDPELRKLGFAGKLVNASSTALFFGAGAGALPQNIVSVYTLYDTPDSSAPPNVGVVLEGVTNLALWSRMILNAGVRHKVKARQEIVKAQVESILYHLQASDWSCPEAEKQIAELIGPKAADECIKLWTVSHGLASIDDSAAPKAQSLPALPSADTKSKLLTAQKSGESKN